MHQTRVLVVHPDPAILALLTAMLEPACRVRAAPDDGRAIVLLGRHRVDSVLAGADPAGDDALALLRRIRRDDGRVRVVLLFMRPHARRARHALRLGAAAVLRHPVPAAELRAAITPPPARQMIDGDHRDVRIHVRPLRPVLREA